MTAFLPSLPPSVPPERAGRGEPGRPRGLQCRRPPLGVRRCPRCAGAPLPPLSRSLSEPRPGALLPLRSCSCSRSHPCPLHPAPPPAPPPAAGVPRALPPPRHPRVPHPSHRASHLSHRTVVAPLKRSPALLGGPFIWGSFMTLCKCAKFLIRLARQPQAALAPRSLHAALCFTAQQAALLL